MSTTAPVRTWTLTCTELGRPPTANFMRRLHHHQRATVDRRWRIAFYSLALEAKVPHLRQVTISAHDLLVDRRSIPDVGANAPAVKAAIDGLVDAVVVKDDSPAYVVEVRHTVPEFVGVAGLVLVVTEVAP